MNQHNDLVVDQETDPRRIDDNPLGSQGPDKQMTAAHPRGEITCHESPEDAQQEVRKGRYEVSHPQNWGALKRDPDPFLGPAPRIDPPSPPPPIEYPPAPDEEKGPEGYFKPPPVPDDTPTIEKQEKRIPTPFHSWGGASWFAWWSLVLTWVISPMTLVALVKALGSDEEPDWQIFHGVATWFSKCLEELWITGELNRLLPCVIFSASAVWLLNRRSSLGIRIGIFFVTAYMSGTWYAQNYDWYPTWAAWNGNWTDVQLTFLFSAASAGGISLYRIYQESGDWKTIPDWKILLRVLPLLAILYGTLMASTNAAF